MNDITRLARTLRQAAKEELMCRETSDTSDLWQDEASPENVLALVETLESDQEQIKTLENRIRRLGGIIDAAEKRISELQEHQKANSAEPVAWRHRPVDDVPGRGGSGWKGPWKLSAEPIEEKIGLMRTEVQPLYAAPIVPEDWTLQDAINFVEEVGALTERDAAYQTWNACRTAILQAGNHSGNVTEKVKQPSSNEAIGGNVYGDEIKQSASNEPVTLIKPLADLYGITSPTGSETTFTFDASEASSFLGSGWSVQEYVELERYQKAVAGNSPVTPDGWIPVSERLPEPGTLVLVYTPPQPGDHPEDVRIGFDYIDPDGDDPTYWFEHGESYDHFCCVACDGMTWPSKKAPYTHWRVLPIAPQQESLCTR
ncbi:DUF551 domain-containing protein [Salmonella enterica]|nr:DUF551 domain-containing protein [Salmonella enterica]